jgi:hypothetical protein
MKGGVSGHFSFSGRQWVPELGDQSSSFFLSLHIFISEQTPNVDDVTIRFGTSTNIYALFFLKNKNKSTEHNNLINDID